MPQPFFLSDVDGTLLHSGGYLTERSETLLRQAVQQGVQFSIASARSIVSLRALFGDFPFQHPVIELNGAYITDYHTASHLQVNCLPRTLAEAAFARVVEHGQRPFVMSFDGQSDHLYYDTLINASMVWYEARRRNAGDPRLCHVTDLHPILREQVVNIVVMSKQHPELLALQHQLHSEFGSDLSLHLAQNEYDVGSYWLTIQDPSANKHVAMKTLLRDTGVDHLTAFGDNVNDVEMLRHADVAVAVENALPEVKVLAHHVIGHQDDDSVAEFLIAQA